MTSPGHRIEGVLSEAKEPKKNIKVILILFILAAAAGFIFVLKAVNISYQKSEHQNLIPLIESSNSSYKFKVAIEEDVKIANLDKEFFSNITKNQTFKNEKIQPIAEEPMDKSELDSLDEQQVTKSEPEVVKEIFVATEVKTNNTTENTIPLSAFAIIDQAEMLSADQARGGGSDQEDPLLAAFEENKPLAKDSKIEIGNPKAKKLLLSDEGKNSIDEKKEDLYRIQIAAFYSKKEALNYLKNLKAKRADLLGDMLTKIEQKSIPNKGLFYRLQLGAFANRDEAKKTCRKFKEYKIDCFVVAPE